MSLKTMLLSLLALAATMAITPSASAGTASADEPSKATPVSAERKLCVAAKSNYLGFSYIQNLKARRTTCRKAKKVVRRYGECKFGRQARGCNPKGFNCDESNVDSSPFQRSAHVVCKDGRKKVVWDYTQNT